MSIVQRAREVFAASTNQVLAAVSGGGDSIALVHLLHASGIPFGIAHFTHHIRSGVAEGERDFIQALADRLGVPFFHGEANVPAIAQARGGNLEQLAREVRYSWLHKTAAAHQYSKIFTAHTKNDNSETVLQQLLRGSAATGGIPPERGMVERPLLSFTGEELRAWLITQSEVWLEDETNLDTSLTRAWLRQDILPALASRYPNVHDTLSRYSALQRSNSTALEELALAWFPQLPLRVAALQHAPRGLSATALTLHLKRHDVPVSDDLINDICEALGSYSSWRRDVTAQVSVTIQYGEFDIIQPVPELTGHHTPWRPLRPGDALKLRVGTKLVSDFLIDEKVPTAERAQLIVREEDGFIVEAAGLFRVWRGTPVWTDKHRHFMALALQKAHAALELGEVPVGAVIVSADGQVLGTGYNRRGADNPLGHAEIAALQEAAQKTGDWRLTGATLYVTLEPCPMCAGAILQTHIRNVVFGADNTRDGAAGTVMNVFGGNWKRQVTVTGGVLAHKSTKLLRTAFESARMR